MICAPDLPLVAAAQRMRDHHVGTLVVMAPGDGHEPVGMITDRDLVVDGLAAGVAGLATLTVAQVMTAELVTAREREDVATVLARMISFGIRRMPVVDEANQLQGILAHDDLLEWLVEQLGALTRVVRQEVSVERGRFPEVTAPARP